MDRKNIINVYTTSNGAELNISAPSVKQVVSATNNRAQYFAEQAMKYRDEAKEHRDNAKYYSEQNSDVTFEQRRGYESQYYLGEPFRLLGRYVFEAGNNFRAGVTAESDAGEPWFKYGGRGFDLYRFYVEVSNLPKVNRVVIGSYRVGFGICVIIQYLL